MFKNPLIWLFIGLVGSGIVLSIIPIFGAVIFTTVMTMMAILMPLIKFAVQCAVIIFLIYVVIKVLFD